MNQDLAMEYFQRRILGHYETHGFGLWALFLTDTKEFIGLAGLISQTINGIEEVELAYRLHPNYLSKGYATESAIAIAEHAFATMKIDRLVSIIDPKNVMVFNYNKQVFDALDRYGITPHIVPFRHRYFWDGGIHCVTSDLHREGTMQNYFPNRS